MTNQPTAAEIQQAIAATRLALTDDVSVVGARAKRLVDWRLQFRSHPALFCGGTALLGFLLVPCRKSAVAPLADTASENGEAFARALPPQRTSALASMSATIGSMIAAAIARQAMSLIAEHSKQFFNQNTDNVSTDD